MSSPLFHTAKAAAYLGLRPQTMRAWRLKGVGPSYTRLGKALTGRVAYDQADLDAYLSARKFRSTSQETVAEASRA
jgi:hypothetical protein